MATQIIALAILVLTSIIGIWKFIARIKSERRRLADEAKKKWDKGNQTPSDFLDTMDKLRRLR